MMKPRSRYKLVLRGERLRQLDPPELVVGIRGGAGDGTGNRSNRACTATCFGCNTTDSKGEVCTM